VTAPDRSRADSERHLRLEGCFNARDLGGLRTADGRVTRTGAIVRADALDDLTAAGWAALHAHGVRTIIDLRNAAERKPDACPRPGDLTTVAVALDGDDPAFWAYWGNGPRFCTPIYYRPHLDRFPELSAAVVAAIARAGPGGVLFHCVAGRDRTGMVAMLVLALAGVSAEDIAWDYALSLENLAPVLRRLGREAELRKVEAFLEEEGTTAPEMLKATLASLDVEAQLRRGGLSDQDLSAARRRLLGPG
jgi:protein tyrosine/serine phosphatase